MTTKLYSLPHLRLGKVKLLMPLIAAFALTVPASTVCAQTDDTSFGTTYEAADGIDDLTGIDPSDDICTTGRPTDDATKVFYLYNPGANRFLSIGGLWGTHVSINSTPYAIWIEKGSTDGTYKLNNKVDGSSTGTYLGVETRYGIDLWMDKGIGTAASEFTFEKADTYTEKNKLYRIKTTYNGTTYYLTTFPDNNERLCNITNVDYANANTTYANQTWKIISKAEYYELAKTNPANMKAVVDFSFLVSDPGFRVNNADAAAWQLWQGGSNTASVFLGDSKMYCTFDKRDGNGGKSHFGGTYNGSHQQNYGKYFYCYSKDSRNFMVYQDVKIHKAGWYILRCNGFSTQQNINGESGPLAFLYIRQMKKDGTYSDNTGTSATLNVLGTDEAKTLMEQSDGAGAGVAFFNGEYENQVQLCITADEDGNTLDADHPVTLRIGFYVAAGETAVSTDNEYTCVDNFKLLYAGEQTSQELILDEDNDNLLYLTTPERSYKNTVMHLHRKLNDNKWNSLVLPVSLTAGQLKRTFGDAVKVAKLAALTEHTIQFTTIETKNDDDVVMQAFEPYIIYPPVVDVTSQPYTVKKFYYTDDDNSTWLNKACTGPSSDENDAFSLTIPKNHYDITMVTLDRTALLNNVDTDTWKSKTSFSAEGIPGTMACYGTMAKTYNADGIIAGRDDLAGDYFFYKGEILQVPTDQQYGLKAFRCWFELTPSTATKENNVAVYIDGVYDSGETGISDIHTKDDTTSRKHGINGVFDLYGNRLRNTNTTDGLPKGIYITNGRKVVVK